MPRVLFGHLTPALFLSRNIFRTAFKHLRWSVFACPVNNFKQLTVCAKTLHLRCLKRFEYACIQIACSKVLRHHNKGMMEYFEFLFGPGIICLPLDIPKRILLTTSLQKDRRGRLIAFISVNTINTQTPWRTTSTIQTNWYHHYFFYLGTNLVFGYILIHSFDKTYVLVVTVELIWLLLWNIFSFNFVPTSNKFPIGWQDSEEAKVKYPAVILTIRTCFTGFLLDVRCTVKSGHVPLFAAVCPQR